MKSNFTFDVLVIGSGLAGLTLALQLDKKLRVALISKSTLQGGASWLAQGGIAAVFDKRTTDAHIGDTLIAEQACVMKRGQLCGGKRAQCCSVAN